MTRVPAMLRRALDLLYLGCGVLAGLMVIGICGLMLALSIGREIGFNLRGGDELTAWFTAGASFLGLAHTFKSGELIRVSLLLDRFHGRARRWLELFALTVAMVFIGLFAWYAARMVWESWVYQEMAQGVLAVPIWIPQAGLGLGIGVLFIALVDEFLHVLAGGAPRYEKPPPRSAEEVVERAAQSGV